ncbi:MAG: small subunit ribosomal protein [Solirubrobacteraceae bacterium]|nr:small subunit ribosomal protein [Solirubrobacteraceae bacterium]
MTDEKNTDETVEETPAAEAPAEEQAPAQEPAAEAEAPVEEPAADEPAAEEPAAAAPVEPEVAAAPDIDPSLPRKERLRILKSRESGAAGPSRTPEERAAERKELRRAKAAARTRRRHQERDKARAARADQPAVEATAPREHGPGRPKTRTGIVVSDKADKTITVRIEDARRHRRYEKIVRSTSTLHAHDESNDANEGDRVTVVESRPLSRLKRWRLVEVLERAK